MKKYVCTVCGYEYDPEVGEPDAGIAPGTPWENVPDDTGEKRTDRVDPSAFCMRSPFFSVLPRGRTL